MLFMTDEMIHSLECIILKLNSEEDEEEKRKFLSENIENPDFLISVLRKINKNKIPKGSGPDIKRKKEKKTGGIFEENAVYQIFQQKTNDAIIQEFSLPDLRNMYESVYQRKPAANYTKERIIHTLRNRMHTIDRTEAFALLAEERKE